MRRASEVSDATACLTLRAGGRDVIFPAGAVRQILPAGAIMHVPLARRGVAGVIAWDGKAIPIYRLSDLLEDGAVAVDRVAAHIVVVEQEGALAGLLVESAEPSRGLAATGPELLDGISLLAAARLFDDGHDDQLAAGAAEGAL